MAIMKKMGEFPVPPRVDELESEEVSEEQEDTTQEESVSKDIESTEIDISKEQKEQFLESILSETPYQETVELFNGKLKVTFRTRTTDESDNVIDKLMQEENFDTILDVERAMAKLHLAFGLVEMITESGKEIIDQGSLKERLERLGKLPTPKYTVLIEELRKFDRRVFRLSELAIQPNFWQTADAG